MVLMVSVALLTLLGSDMAASRITWAMARDDALVFSHFIKRIDRTHGTPIWAYVFNGFWVMAMGCIYLGSTTGKTAVKRPLLTTAADCWPR